MKHLEEQIINFLSQDPNFCVAVGLEKNLGDLPDPGKNARLKKQGKIRMYQNELKKIEPKDADQELDIKLWHLYLEQHRLELDLEIGGIPKKMRMPRAFREVIDPIFLLFINDPRKPEHRLVNIISRLKKVQPYIMFYSKNIRTPIERWVQMELQSLRGVDTFFDSIRDWANSIEFKNMSLLDEALTQAKTAFVFYENFLKDCPIEKNFHLGKEQMREVLYARGINLEPSEIHQIAKDFMTKNKKEIESLREIIINKHHLSDMPADELQKWLAQNFKVENNSSDFSDVLDRYKREQDLIKEWMSEKNLFPDFEGHSLEIIKTPDFMEPTVPAGAMLCPLPLREGHRKSFIYLTLKEELLDEHTELSIPNMMIHEGIPGHHLQLAFATTHESIIRRLMSANDLAEGWTTMLEDYMLDQGYRSELEDELRFSAKRDIARLAARVAIDLYFMSGDKKYLDIGIDCDLSSEDPFVCAGNLLKEVTGFVDSRIQGELNWYSQESGYPLSYLVGNKLMLDLKKSLVDGKGMSDFEFHQFILGLGKVPLSLVNVSV